MKYDLQHVSNVVWINWERDADSESAEREKPEVEGSDKYPDHFVVHIAKRKTAYKQIFENRWMSDEAHIWPPFSDAS